MTRPINLDIDEIRDDFFKGLTRREFFYGLSAFLIGAGEVFFLVFYVGLSINLAVTLGLPVIALIGLCGFYQKNGMTLIQLAIRCFLITTGKPLTYRTGVQQTADETKEIKHNKNENSKEEI